MVGDIAKEHFLYCWLQEGILCSLFSMSIKIIIISLAIIFNWSLSKTDKTELVLGSFISDWCFTVVLV